MGSAWNAVPVSETPAEKSAVAPRGSAWNAVVAPLGSAWNAIKNGVRKLWGRFGPHGSAWN